MYTVLLIFRDPQAHKSGKMLNVHEFEILPTFTSSYLTNGKIR